MTLNERLFIIVPLLSLLCNLFLFLTALGTKKDRLVYAFIALLGAFTMWSGGSLFMRLQLAPGSPFWYMVSITGIFLVPFLVYNFIYRFTATKAPFSHIVQGAIWLVILLLNAGNVFITDPHMVTVGHETRFEYGVSPLVAIPILMAVYTLLASWRLAYKSCRNGQTDIAQFRPLLVGVAVMFACTVSAVLPQMVSLPVDTFSCMVNACCLYYMLYRRRLVPLRSFASNGPVFAIALICASVLLVSCYRAADAFYARYFANFMPYKTIVFSVAVSVLTVLLFCLVRRLMTAILLKGAEQQNEELRRFSTDVNKTLSMNALLQLYRDYLQHTMPGYTARIFVLDSRTGCYEMRDATEMSVACRDSFAADDPLMVWLKSRGCCSQYAEFTRSRYFRALWQKEKDRLDQMRVELLLPVMSGEEMTALTLFSRQDTAARRALSQDRLSMLDSVAAVLAIALNNASLYEALRKKAQFDPLTGLYNRSYFQEVLQRDFDLARHDQLTVLIISFDDFRLYNELYGAAEGDRILKRFANALRVLVGSRGTVARYSGKEFVISFPFCAPDTAADCAEQARQWLRREVVGSGQTTRRFLTFCAGISSYPTCARSVEELLTYAGMAVYSAKNSGKNRMCLYTPEPEDTRIAKSYASKRALADSCSSTIFALTAAIDAKDHYTFSHSQHVAEYAAALARAAGLDAEHIEIVRQAGLLHDIGKIGTPETILSKTGRLTAEEYDVIKQHVEDSISMIRYLPSMDYVIPSVLGHHERLDGQGYPRGIAGEQIPIGARCLCLADSFDAMVSRRSYKDALSVDRALQEIEDNLGSQFDPRLGKLFIDLVRSGKIQVHADAAPEPSSEPAR